MPTPNITAVKVKSGRWIGTGPAGRCHGHDHATFDEALACARQRALRPESGASGKFKE